MKLSDSEKTEILTLARKVIEAEFSNSSKLEISPNLQKRVEENAGIFVTLKEGNKMRGRGGDIEQNSFGIALISAAKEAAFNDHRFNPLNKDELNKIKIEINIFENPVEVSSQDVLNKIKLGKTGVVIKSGAYSSVILPQDATEEKWTKEELLENSCIKAGLLPDAWKDSTTIIYLFDGEVISE